MKELIKRFEKETGNKFYAINIDNGEDLYNSDFVEWMAKQLALCNVSCSLPSKEEIHIEAEKYQDEQLNDPLALTYDAFIEGCNYVIKKQKQKSD